MHDASTVVSPASEEREPEELDAGSTRTSATDLGDVTVHRLPEGLQRLVQTVGFEGDAVDYYRFELTESREVRMALQARSGEVQLYLEDSVGEVLSRSMAFASYELVVRTLPAGTYYLRVLPVGNGGSEYEFKYGVYPADDAWRPWDPEPSLAERLGMPSFEESEYGFALAEHADGSLERVSLGVVTATDPDGEALHYALVGENESGRFAIDAETGELFYAGPGEDYEGGAGPHELTVRASDGTHTVDATVTVTVTDVPEAPAFTQASYAFALAEHADGSEARVALGTVTATDPDGDTLHYTLVGGNESGRFAIDAETGELFYAGPGEDYESGAGPHELTVRVSDGTHTDEATQTVDATVTVTVTDVPEAPAFTQASYAFALAEHTDGSEARVSLGVVAATDPDGDALRYALVGGNESGRFAIDAETGELFYAGPGEDYESGTGSHELTVRAGDGTHTVDATVTVTVTDVGNDSEPADGDLPADRTTGAVVRVDEGPVRGRIESTQDVDWFAVDLVGGRTYQFDQRGHSSDDGTLIDPYLLGLFDSEGAYIGGTTAPDGGIRYDSRLEFTAARDGRHYIAAAGNGYEESGTGTYELEVRTVPAPVFGASSYAFVLAENVDGSETSIALGTVQATDPDGDTLRYRLVGGNESGRFAIDASSGELSYVGAGEDYESGAGPYELTVRASDGTHTDEATVTVTVTDVAEAPAFSASSYAFVLTENAGGGETGISLGTVQAVDPDGDTVRYSLEGGNESGLFAINEASGEIFYVGPGEDFESGAGPFELTVRASDGARASDTVITVTVTDLPEAPSFAASSYAFDLAENTDGSETRIALGTVTATDPDGDALRYSVVGGNESGRFAIDETTGELAYVGTGEDHESVGSHELTVRASDGTYTADASVTVTVTDAPEAPSFAESSYAFDLAENTDGSGTRISLGTVTATDPDGDALRYSVVGGNESGLFVIDTESGELSYVGTGEAYEGGASPFELTVRTSDGTHTVDVAVTVSVSETSSGSDKEQNRQAKSEPAGEDLPAGQSTSGEVVVGAEEVEGRLDSPSDRDWFQVTLAPGRTYAFDLEGDVPDGGTVPKILGLRDSNGTSVPGITGGTEVRYTTEETGAESVYYVEVGGSGTPGQGASAPRGLGTRGFGTLGFGVAPLGSTDGGSRYRLRANDITETRDATDDYGSSIPGTVAVGGTARGEIERSGDRDWFAVTLVAGQLYRIDLEGSPTSAGTLKDPYLRGIHDAAGNLISGTTNDDGGTGRNSRLVFEPDTPGIYYIAAGASGSRTGTYRVSVTEFDDDYTAGIDTAGTVVVGGSAPGAIERSGDRDWFAVTLAAGSSYRIDLEGSPTSAGTLTNPYLRGIHDAAGELIAGTTNDNGGHGHNSRLYFEPQTSGTYYVAAGGAGITTGTYRVSVTELDDDYTAGTDTAGTVAVGGSAPGAIERPGDRDWFAVTLEAGTPYRIDLERELNSDRSLHDPYLRGIHDAAGNLIAGTTDNNGGVSGLNSRIFFEPETSGIHYIAAGASGSGTGTYRVRVTDATDDYADGTHTTGKVAVFGRARGEVEQLGDLDWFAVTLEAGKTYQIDLESWEALSLAYWNWRTYRLKHDFGTLPDPFLRGIYDSHGNLISGTTDYNGGAALNSRVSFAPESDGTYYIAAGGTGGAVWGLGSYTLSVTRTSDDYAAGTDTTGTVEVDGTARRGDIERAGDQDWFAVTLVAGTPYHIAIRSVDTSAGGIMNPYLRGIHDSLGNLIPDTARFGGVHFTPESDGKYYIAVGSWWEDGAGSYEVRVSDLTDDHAAGTGTTGTVAVGGTARGEIERSGDRDWFAVTLVAGQLYRIDLEGSPTSAGTLKDPYLRGIHDAAGNLISGTTNDDGGTGRNSRLVFEPDTPGIHYIAAGASGSRTGTYRVSVTELDDDYTAGIDTAGTVVVGGSAPGAIERSGDRDWFAVTLAAGSSYRIDLEGSPTSAGTLTNPYLRGIHDAAGELIAGTTNDNGGHGHNSRLYFEPQTSGTYYVAAGGAGITTGTYRVSVTELDDDYTAGTDTAGTVAVGGSAPGAIERPGDRDWFAVTLEAGTPYRIDLERELNSDRSLHDPYLRGIHVLVAV